LRLVQWLTFGPAALQLPTIVPTLQIALQAALQATLPAALQGALPAALDIALAELYIMTAQVSATLFIVCQCSNNSQNHNRIVVDGLSVRFYEVQYQNGDRPTQQPVSFFTTYTCHFIMLISLSAQSSLAGLLGYH
jgi:hypothetical protein